jgi:hypothetical protein
VSLLEPAFQIILIMSASVGERTFQNLFQCAYFLNKSLIVVLVSCVDDPNQLSGLLESSGHIRRKGIKGVMQQIVVYVLVRIDGCRESFVCV